MRKVLLISFGLVLSAANAMAQNAADAATINNSMSKNAASTGTLTAPIEKLHSRPSKWSTSAYIGNWGDIKVFDGGPKNTSFTDIYVEPKKDIGNGQSLGLRINAQQYERGDKDKDKLVIGDPQAIYRNKVFSSSARLSMPVLEHSRLTGRHELRLNGGTDLIKSGHFTTSLLLEARGYGYTRDKGGQLMARGRNGIGLTYEINNYVTPYFNALYDVRWNNSGEGVKLLNVDQKADPSNLVRYHWFDLGATFVLVPKHLNFDAYVTQIRAFDANTAFLSKEDTGYNFELSATF